MGRPAARGCSTTGCRTCRTSTSASPTCRPAWRSPRPPWRTTPTGSWTPPGTRHRPESRFALGERQRGVDVPRLDGPLLVVAGRSHPVDRGQDVADHYGGDLLAFPDLDHTGLVRDAAVVTAITDWLAAVATDHRR